MIHNVEIQWSRVVVGDGVRIYARVQHRNPDRYFGSSRDIVPSESLTEEMLRHAEYRVVHEAVLNFVLWCQEGKPAECSPS